MKVYINNKEYSAVNRAYDYILNLMENCPAGDESDAIKSLQYTLDGLMSIQDKVNPKT